MSVVCAHCGEELLGAVNRCWNCGREVVSRPGPSNVPPIRRVLPGVSNASAESEAPVEASVDSSGDSVELEESAQENTMQGAKRAVSEVGSRGQESPARGSRSIFYGSPFSSPKNATSRLRDAPAAVPRYPEHAAASGAAIASVCLGVMAVATVFVFSETPLASLVLSGLGICMGLWGVYSNRRGLASLGLLICILAFAYAGFLSVVQLYTMIHGSSPFETLNTDDLPLE